MKKPFFSLIIPAYNSYPTLKVLLNSIFKSDFKDLEVVLVDDGSSDKTDTLRKNYPISYFKIKRGGAGRARNIGASRARGEFLVFLDSDISLFPDTLLRLAQIFKKNPNLAVVGTYNFSPLDSGFVPSFKALRDHAYWQVEKKESQSPAGFGGWLSAVRKDIFFKTGGFREDFKGAGIEDFEFGSRLSQSVEIVAPPAIKVSHFFGNFLQVSRGYFLRSVLFAEFFLKKRYFFQTGATLREAIIGALAIISFASLILAFFYSFLWSIFFYLFLLRLYLARHFIYFTFQKKRFIFMLGAIILAYIFHLVIYVGAFYGFLKLLVKK